MTDEQIRRVKELRDACFLQTDLLKELYEVLIVHRLLRSNEAKRICRERIDQATEAIKKVEGLIV